MVLIVPRPTASTDPAAPTPDADAAGGPSAPSHHPFLVLYLCTANICRSPFAELLSRARAGRRSWTQFGSGGIDGLEPQPIDPLMAAELVDRGADPSGLFGVRYRVEDLEVADLVLTMTAAQHTRMIDEVPAQHHKLFTLGQFTKAVAGAGRRLRPRDLVAFAAHQRPGLDPDDDVPDPYRRGSSAARESARIIDDHLMRLLPRIT